MNNIEVQMADALIKADVNNKSNTKKLSLVVLEDPLTKEKTKIIVTNKIDVGSTVYLQVTGYPITLAQSKNIKTWEDVTALVTENKLELINIQCPWVKVCYINNIVYKTQ